MIKPDVFAAIMDHFASGEPMIMDQEALAKSDTAIHPEDDEVSHGLLMGPSEGVYALLLLSISWRESYSYVLDLAWCILWLSNLAVKNIYAVYQR